MKNVADKESMLELCRYIEAHCDQPLTLKSLARRAGLSADYFQRCFSRTIGLSPKKYQQACRLKLFKNQLKGDEKIIDAMQRAGYQSSSRLYEKLDSQMGMIPSRYRQGGAGESISYASEETDLGCVMIAATDCGICFLQFSDDQKSLLERLKVEYPHADCQPMGAEAGSLFKQWMIQLNDFLLGRVKQLQLPIDIRGTVFQTIVWGYLTQIPPGTVQSYTEVATAIGKPRAVRAVASACANNKIAIAIPCHRVIRGDGSLAGYKWGLERKKALLDLERGTLSKS